MADSKRGEGLEVHHVCYVRGKEPWEYPDELLKCLCPVCHYDRQISDEDALYQFARKIARMGKSQVYSVGKTLKCENGDAGRISWFDAETQLRKSTRRRHAK